MRKRKIMVYTRVEAVEDEGEGNLRERKANSRYGDIKLWLICIANWKR